MISNPIGCKRKIVSAIEGTLILTNLALGGILYDQARLSKEQALELQLQDLKKQTSEREMQNDIVDCLFMDMLRESVNQPDWTLADCRLHKEHLLEQYRNGQIPQLESGNTGVENHE